MTTGTPVAASHLPIASDPDNLLEHLDHLVFEPLARLITAMAHESITDKPNRATSLSASWFLHPKQHAVELVLMNVIIGLMLYNYVGVAWREK